MVAVIQDYIHDTKKHSEKATEEAERRVDDDFKSLTVVLECYMKDHGVLLYCVMLQCLASRYLGGGLLDPIFTDENILIGPLHSSHWCFGIWETGAENVLTNVQSLNDYRSLHHTLTTTWTVSTNQFEMANHNTTIISSMSSRTSGHIFSWIARLVVFILTELCLKRQKLLLASMIKFDLMVAARIGKEGYIWQTAGYNTSEDDTRIRYVSWAIFEVSSGKTKHRDTQELEDLSRARMTMTRICVYHVGQKHVGDSPGITGGCIACMAFERACYQVDVIAGDGNKACYCSTPKSPGVPSYETSLLQYWINKMMNVATQARNKHFGVCPVRVKHFMSCSYRDLVFLATHLGWHYNRKIHHGSH